MDIHVILCLGVRVLGAVQFLGYKKLLKLSSPNDAILGQFITFLSADHERIQVFLAQFFIQPEFNTYNIQGVILK